MRGLQSIIRSSIMHSSLIESHPLRIHALASIYDWDGVAQASAMRCLDFDIGDPQTIIGLRGTSLEHYSRLLSLARRRQQLFHERLENTTLFGGSHPDYTCKICNTPPRDLSWKVLRMRLVDEIGKHASGTTIERDAESWPEWKAAMGSTHCGSALYHEWGTHKKIMSAIAGLPTKLDAE